MISLIKKNSHLSPKVSKACSISWIMVAAPSLLRWMGSQVKWQRVGTGSPAAGLGSLVRHIGHYPHYPAKCVDNVPGQHPSLQPSPQFGAISAQLAAWWPGNCGDQMRLQKIGNCSSIVLMIYLHLQLRTCEDRLLSLRHYYKLPSCHTIKLFMNLKLLLEDSHNKSST